MSEEARLVEVGAGLAPEAAGWFVVNAREAAWIRNDAFGGRCTFESSPRVLVDRPDIPPQRFPETGFTLAVLEPGKPSSLYHAESCQEDFLVLAGTCLLVIEEEERELRAWDFVHCPPGTHHVFVGKGDEPCVLFMIGARREGRTIDYQVSELAGRTEQASRSRRPTRPRPTPRSLRGASGVRRPGKSFPGPRRCHDSLDRAAVPPARAASGLACPPRRSRRQSPTRAAGDPSSRRT